MQKPIEMVVQVQQFMHIHKDTLDCYSQHTDGYILPKQQKKAPQVIFHTSIQFTLSIHSLTHRSVTDGLLCCRRKSLYF